MANVAPCLMFGEFEYCSAFSGSFGAIQDARALSEQFFGYYNHEHRHSGIGLHTPASVHYGIAIEIRAERARTLKRGLHGEARPVPRP